MNRFECDFKTHLVSLFGWRGIDALRDAIPTGGFSAFGAADYIHWFDYSKVYKQRLMNLALGNLPNGKRPKKK